MLGANPIEMTGTDTYLALEEAPPSVLCPLAPVRSYKISDAAKTTPSLTLWWGFLHVMNQERFDELPLTCSSF